MSKYVALYVIVLAGLGLIAMEQLDAESGHPQAIFSLVENQRETDEKAGARQRFRAVFEPTIHALMDGQISLREACAKVYATAQVHSPVYLKMLESVEPGRCIEERIGHNLVGHARDQVVSVPNSTARVALLEAELQEMVSPIH